MNKEERRARAHAQGAALQTAEYVHAEDKEIKSLIAQRDKATADRRRAQEALNARTKKLQEDSEVQKLQRRVQVTRKKLRSASVALRSKLQPHIDAKLRDGSGEE